MNHAAWLEARRGGIGGSDVAAIMGVSKWRTPLDVYLEKIGESAGQPENEAMRWGKRLEPVVIAAFEEEAHVQVERVNGILKCEARPWMLATIDGYTDDPRAIVEAKTARTADGWGDAGTADIPLPYYLQVQHYLCVTGDTLAYVPVLIGGQDFRVYEIDADQTLHQQLIEIEEAFWCRVQRRDPPEPRTAAEAMRLWRTPEPGKVVAADDDTRGLVALLAAIRAEAAVLEASESEVKAKLMRAMGDAEAIMDGDRPIVTWKAAKPTERLDTARIKAERPDIWQDFAVTGEAGRMFLLK